MMVTEDSYVVATTEAESALMPMPICALCGCGVSLKFRAVHNERCKND